jgi:cell division protein FtsI/penicillin-binding protein 2
MRLAVTNVAANQNSGTLQSDDSVAGKTGTAEYCDKYALEKNRYIRVNGRRTPGQFPLLI